MKAKMSLCLLLLAIFALLLSPMAVRAAESPKQPVSLKIEGAKMAPVSFSHAKHEAAKIDCAKCHHKDAQDPKSCTTCHDVKQAKGKAPAAKDAFHNRCQTCHKEAAGKAPTKCNECHKK